MTMPVPTRRERLGARYRSSLVGHPGGRDFRRLWAGDTVSQLGTGVGEVAVPLLAVTVLGASAFQMGLLSTVERAAFLLVGLPAGAWVDRMSKRDVLVAGDVVRGVALLALPVAWLTGVLSLPLVLVVVAVTGVATVFFDVAYQSYLPSLVAPERISEGNANLQVSASAAGVVGPGLGGALVRVLGAPLVIALDALSFLASVGFTLAIAHREESAPREGRRPLRTEVTEGLSFVVRQPLLRRIVATTALSNLFGAVPGALLVLYAVRELGVGASGVGLALSITAVGGLVGAVTAQPVIAALGEGRTIAWSLVPTLPLLALVPLADGRGRAVAIAMLAVSGAIAGVGIVVYNVAQVSFRQRLCPRPLLGRMNASIRFAVWGVMPIGSFAGGLLATHLGVVAALWISVVGEALAVLPVLLSPLAGRREPPADAPAAPSVGAAAPLARLGTRPATASAAAWATAGRTLV